MTKILATQMRQTWRWTFDFGHVVVRAHVSNLSIDNSVEQNVKHAAEQYGPHRPDNKEVDSDDCDSDDEIDDLDGNEKSSFEGRIDGIENAGLTIGKALSFYNRQGESLESLVSLVASSRKCLLD